AARSAVRCKGGLGCRSHITAAPLIKSLETGAYYDRLEELTRVGPLIDSTDQKRELPQLRIVDASDERLGEPLSKDNGEGSPKELLDVRGQRFGHGEHILHLRDQGVGATQETIAFGPGRRPEHFVEERDQRTGSLQPRERRTVP